MNGRTKYLREYLKTNGAAAALGMVVRSVLGISNGKKYKRFVEGLEDRDYTARFSEIYEKGLWKGGESRSGAGSELAYTENLRFFLPILFEQFGIRTIVDAPCGDFHWMRLVPLLKEMSYVGLDIVPKAIAENRKRYEDDRRKFAVANITTDPLPTADLLICRDCLFHLTNKDIALLLQNFVASKSSYLLTSTHVNEGSFVNTDIDAGAFRLIDLFSEPFCFPRQVLYRIDDYVQPFPPREICLWDREQIVAVVQDLPKRLES
jgi:hypothetical protein